MKSYEFDEQFARLKNHFYPKADANMDQVSLEWFKALGHYHVDALERGITDLIRTSTERFWPQIATLHSLIRARIGAYEKQPGKCATCHGSTWVEAWPVIWCGNLYEQLQRCPDCGVPAPEVKKTLPGSRPATKQEYDDWREGTFARDTMPDWAKAKPMKPGQREAFLVERQEFYARLHRKLFGTFDQHNGDVA
jgi:hypothetical protein